MIGAGRRAQNNFLPVLSYLRAKDAIALAGIHSRTADRLKPVAEHWDLPAVLRLEDIDLSAVDVASVSVPTGQNASVLRSLVSRAPHLTVVIDTPIAWNRRELSTIAPLLRKFRRVLVTEDYMNFPSFSLLRDAVKSGLIGEIRGVTLNNIGFLYHGLALIRSFCDFEPVRTSWSRKISRFAPIVGYNFKNGYTGVVIGPYRKHRAGGITVEGETGILTDFPSDKEFAGPGKKAIYTLSFQRTQDGVIEGIALDDAGSQYHRETPELVEMARMDFGDKSDLNLLRGCGLLKVFEAISQPDNINNLYGPSNAFYDSFVSRVAERGLFPFDPLTWLGSDAVRFATRFL